MHLQHLIVEFSRGVTVAHGDDGAVHTTQKGIESRFGVFAEYFGGLIDDGVGWIAEQEACQSQSLQLPFGEDALPALRLVQAAATSRQVHELGMTQGFVKLDVVGLLSLVKSCAEHFTQSAVDEQGIIGEIGYVMGQWRLHFAAASQLQAGDGFDNTGLDEASGAADEQSRTGLDRQRQFGN